MMKLDGENTLVFSAVNGEDIKVVRKFSADGLEIVSNVIYIERDIYRNNDSLYH